MLLILNFEFSRNVDFVEIEILWERYVFVCYIGGCSGRYCCCVCGYFYGYGFMLESIIFVLVGVVENDYYLLDIFLVILGF